MRAPVVLLLILAVALATGGCAADAAWTFGATRWSFHEDVYRSSGGSSEFLLLVLGVFIAVDLAFLPVSIPHDIWWWTHDTAP